MKHRRWLAATMCIFMLMTSVLPVFSYASPFEEDVVTDWSDKAQVSMNGSAVAYQNYGGSAVTSFKTTTAVTSDSLTAEPGALRLSGVTASGSLSTSPSTAEKYSNIIDTSCGMTLDLNAKLSNLPMLSSDYINDDGATTANIFGGFIFDIASDKAYWADSTKYNNELYMIFVRYENVSLETNAALIITAGNRNAMANLAQTTPYTYFFNLPEDYARYTVRIDTENQTTNFYINGEAQMLADGETTIPTAALLYRTTATSNFIYINCNSGHATVNATIADYYADVYIDEFNIFPYALTPEGYTPSAFIEEPPLDTSELLDWMDAILDLNEQYYSEASWKRMQGAVGAVDLTKDDLTQSEVMAWKSEIEAAFAAREYVGTDRLYIADTFSTSNTATNGSAWTCGSLLFTEEGYWLGDYTVSSGSSAMQIASWTRITGVRVSDGIYRITKVVNGAYRDSNKPAIAEDEVVPENGFIFAFHSNEEDAAWNPVEGGSQYAAQEFGERNAIAFRNMNLEVGSLVTLKNVQMNFEGDSVLSTTGTWVHRYEDGVVNTPIYRPSALANASAVEGDPQYLARDQFEDFETNSYITLLQELPNLHLSVEGAGSITYGDVVVDNSATQSFTINTGDAVTLEAQGEDFFFWKNAKTGAIISTDAELSFTFRLSEMDLVAVFATVEQGGENLHPVTFKDGITGRIIATLEVEDGTVVPADLVPSITAIEGYTFAGWYADAKPANAVETYEISGRTIFVARYTKDNSQLYKLTVKVNGNTREFNRRFGSLANVEATGDFSYWTLDGAFLTADTAVCLSMPNRDATLEAVYGVKVESVAPSTAFTALFVDANGTLTATLSRSIPEGYALLESGILMTRKATAADLVVGDAYHEAVTRGVSTASEGRMTFGFAKTDMFEKTGTWLVRGYLSYKDQNGDEQVAYTAIYSLNVSDSAVEGSPVMSPTSFGVEGELDPYTPSTIVYEAASLGDDALRPFFPTVTQAEDGTLIVVYYYSDGHALYYASQGKLSGVLQMTKSFDGGKSWTTPETIVDLTDEDVENGDYNREARDPNLQRLSDGTLILTFPVRAPIGKPGLNPSTGKYYDYWGERSYYMTSMDNGVTWSDMTLIECDFFSTEPFLYDDPDRTTGCWIKNGSIAELPGGELLFPLYGSQTCDSRGDYYGVVVKAKNNGDGTLTFVKDWAVIDGVTTDAALIQEKGTGSEVGLVAYGNTVYALARTPSSDEAENADVFRSYDGGKTWECFATEYTENECLNQPNFTYVTDELVLANYAVPLASATSHPAKRTARPVYGKLFNVRTGDWDEYDAITIYDVTSATVADMGNPSSVLMDDGRIFTVYYDTSAPETKLGFIGGTYTTIDHYRSISDGSLKTEELLADNFDDDEAKDYVTVYRDTYDRTGDTIVRTDLNENFDAVVYQANRKGGSTVSVGADGKVVITSNSFRAATPFGAITTKTAVNGDAILQFDYTFGSVATDGYNGSRNRIGFAFYNEEVGNATPSSFYITPGQIVLDSTSNSYVMTHSAETVYTLKAMYISGMMYVKAWEKGTAEPGWQGSAELSLSYGNPFSIWYEARSSSASTSVEYSAILDNVQIQSVQLEASGLSPSMGLYVELGSSAAIKVTFDTNIVVNSGVTMQAYSDSPSVAQLSSDGTVTGLSRGVANIYARTGGKVFTLRVIVI